MYGGAKHGAFQKYTTCREVVVAKIPDNLPFAEAVVLPLALSTSMVALFELLQLALPSTESRSTGKSVLVWGGSSSIGSIAIQLVAAAGYKVITTASAKNHEYVKELGATAVFDHSDPNVTSLLIEALKGSDCAGVYDCIGTDETKAACADILGKMGGGVLPVVTWPLPANLPPSVKPVLGTFGLLEFKEETLLTCSISLRHESRLGGEPRWCKTLERLCACSAGGWTIEGQAQAQGHNRGVGSHSSCNGPTEEGCVCAEDCGRAVSVYCSSPKRLRLRLRILKQWNHARLSVIVGVPLSTSST